MVIYYICPSETELKRDGFEKQLATDLECQALKMGKCQAESIGTDLT